MRHHELETTESFTESVYLAHSLCGHATVAQKHPAF